MGYPRRWWYGDNDFLLNIGAVVIVCYFYIFIRKKVINRL